MILTRLIPRRPPPISGLPEIGMIVRKSAIADLRGGGLEGWGGRAWRLGSASLPENRTADPHMGGAEPDRGLIVGAHAHRQELQAVAGRDLGGEGEMRGRGLVERGYAH